MRLYSRRPAKEILKGNSLCSATNRGWQPELQDNISQSQEHSQEEYLSWQHPEALISNALINIAATIVMAISIMIKLFIFIE